MSQKIELTRIHAINWFGYQDTFDINGNLLIAGVTGSGKSILMDLIQLVLIGDQKSKYNQSATGRASSRTLKSYCLGDTKDEIDGLPQFMRNDGAVTYVALEFTWPDNKRVETWGLRIEFDNAAQNSPSRRHGFMIPKRLDKIDWIDTFGFPLEFPAFRDFVNELEGKSYDTMESYRREMALTRHLNYDRDTLDYLLPAAMSFTFLDNFNKFCRNYVLPPDEIRIQEVRDSYHAFLSLRRELTALRQQLDLLESISNDFKANKQSIIDQDLYAEISRELKCEELRELVEEIEEEIQELEEQAISENSREFELDTLLKDGRERRDVLRNALNESEDGRLYLHIRDDNRKLVGQINQLREAGNTIAEARVLRCKMIRNWLNNLVKTGIQLPHGKVKAMEKALNSVEQCELHELTENLETLADAVRDLHFASKDAEKPLRDEVEKKVNKLRTISARLETLDRGQVSQRSALLDSINSTLPRRRNGDPAAFALRELCEVKDERWRPAVEIAFTRKFAVVVEEENYRFAETIYREMKGGAPGESLIHPEQALDLNPRVEPDSLAQHLECHDPVAQAIVDHLFGRLICVEDAKDLTKHNSAILPDGFTYRRPFAERRSHYDNIPYIGSRGLKQQKSTLEQERQKLRKELERLQPLAELLAECEQNFRKQRLDSPSLGSQLADIQQLKSCEDRLQDNIERLKSIESGGFEEKEAELGNLEHTLGGYERELKSLRKSELKIELGKRQGSLEDLEEQLSEAEDELTKFIAENPHNAEHKQRREQLYQNLSTEFPALDLAVAQAIRLERACIDRSHLSWAAVVENRKELSREFPIYNEFAPDDKSNAPWEERLERIANSDIPAYQAKAEREEKNWQNIFRKQVLVKLRSALMRVDLTLKLLNKELKKPIGIHLYQIRKKRNPDFAVYQRLVDNSALAEEGTLFFDSIDAEAQEEVERIFNTLVEDPNNPEALNFLDYRNYYDYDMSVLDTRDPDGRETSVDKQSGKFSGGENQSPYFIAILACYLRAYHRYDHKGKEPSIGLVPIDEAFSKLSGERIRDCIEALRALGLQGAFSMSSGNIPYAIDLCDQTMVVSKKEHREGKINHIRNIAVSLTRKEAIRKLVKS